jgi:DNA-binding response OmpR family regulator
MPPIKVLYIEDKPDMIELIKLMLAKKNFEVAGAVGGKEGLDALQQSIPDIVLLDLMMPDMDGWEVFRAMKANRSFEHIPVIVLTARAQSIDKVLGLHIAKVDDYLTKPFSQGELIASIDRVLAAKRPRVDGS